MKKHTTRRHPGACYQTRPALALCLAVMHGMQQPDACRFAGVPQKVSLDVSSARRNRK
jgi:hypothetical protein